MEVLITVLTILGSIVVASISYFLTKSREREAEWRKEKLRFYIEFVESLSGITDCEGTPENDVKFAKSCNNLYLFASPSVLDSLRNFQEEIRITNTNKSFENYTTTLSKLILEIRKDIKVRDQNEDKFTVLLWTSGHKESSKKFTKKK